MTSPGQPDLLAWLTNLMATRDEFQAAVAGLTEEQARFKPSAERWSIEEIVEHVAVAEYGMYRFLTKLYEVSDDPRSLESAASLARASDRAKMPLPAPERVHPKQRFGSLFEALAKFLENRERTIEFVKSCADDLRLRIIQHPLGVLNGPDCVAVLMHHPVRHLAQINELKAHPAFPR